MDGRKIALDLAAQLREGHSRGDLSLWPGKSMHGTTPMSLSLANRLEQEVICLIWRGFHRWRSFTQPFSTAYRRVSAGLPRLCLQTTAHPARDEASSAASSQALYHLRFTLISHFTGDVNQKIFWWRGEKSLHKYRV